MESSRASVGEAGTSYDGIRTPPRQQVVLPTFELPRRYPHSPDSGFKKEDEMVRFEGITAIGTDLDGVWLNYRDYAESASQLMLARYGIHYQLDELRRLRENSDDLFETTIRLVLEKLGRVGDLDTDNKLRDELVAIEKEKFGHFRDILLVCDIARDWLNSELPVPFFAATNRMPDAAFEGIYHIGIERLADAYVSQDPLRGIRRKPEADMFVEAMNRLNLSGKVIYLEDTPSHHAELKKNVLNATDGRIEIVPIGILPPGFGYSKQFEDLHFKGGAVAVFPTVTHFFKDLAKGLKKFWLHELIKEDMQLHRRSLGRQMGGRWEV
ncbi:MAG: hypothetical protein D6719_13005 [Candidatus Dadabacteria bacterium]|nr:MAG: hypothetical protein D6719_13005 [Candidatus Dadabacteria bacterium]